MLSLLHLLPFLTRSGRKIVRKSPLDLKNSMKNDNSDLKMAAKRSENYMIVSFGFKNLLIKLLKGLYLLKGSVPSPISF